MNVPHKKLQSAMEYLMTYGWAILVIAVVIGVLYAMGIFNGSGLLGSFCTAQTGYFCANPILSTNSPTLNVTIGQDTRLEWPAWKIFAVRGTAFNANSPNITGSGAFYNGEKQIVAIPLNSILGNYIPIGTPFSGSLWAEYCNTPNCNTPDQVSEIGIFSTKAAKLGYVTTSVSTSSISTTSTTSTSTTSTSSTSTTSTSTTSTATTAPTTTIAPSGIIYSVPITLTNSQSSNTPAPFQQMVNISESAYPNYLTYNGNSANFEFFTSSGTVLPAWIESNNSGKLVMWVKLPNGIPAKSNTIIYLGFASTSNNLFSSTGKTGIGEAPQLPCGSTATSSCSTYAEYDDGASVFNYYTNFAGTSLPTGWVASGTSYTTDNGIVLFSNNVGVVSINYGSFNIVSTNVFDAYGYSTATGSGINNPISAGLVDGSTSSSSLGIGTPASGSNYVGYTYTSSVGVPTTNLGVSASTQMHIFTLYQTHSTADWQIDYGVLFSSTVGYVAATSSPLNLYSTEPASGQAFVQWIRVRAYPPNGVMPSTTFGVIQGGSPSVTVSPSSVSLLPGTGFTLTAAVSNGTSPYTYQWYNATSGTGIPIAGATSSTYTATAGSTAGTFDYYVKVTDSESKTVQSSNSVVTVSLPPSGIIYSVPITLTNSQSSNTPAPFQQMVNISESTYSSYITYNGNSANFEYISPSGIVLPAWIESNNSGKLITWVKLPNGIPAKSSITIYLGFASKSNNLLLSSGTTGIGEAPQLSPTYAEYDDGANVFNFYSDFKGNTLNTNKWIESATGTISIIINNGITLSQAGSTEGYIYSTSTFGTNTILEFYGKNYQVSSSGSNYCANYFGYSNPTVNTGFSVLYTTEFTPCGYINPTQSLANSNPTGTSYNLITPNTNTNIWGLAYNGTGTHLYSDYTQLTTLNSYEAYYPLPLSFIEQAESGWTFYVQFTRVRAYPPNGIMPSAAFG